MKDNRLDNINGRKRAQTYLLEDKVLSSQTKAISKALSPILR